MIGNSKQPKISRKRGVVLTATGLKRLQTAIERMEIADNKGEHLTLEKLGDRMKISTKTLSRLWSRNIGVDRKTLQQCYGTFNLELSEEDYRAIDGLPDDEMESSSEVLLEQCDKQYFGPYPNGPVPLDSPLYIERPPIEELAYREITQLGCLIRIRAPKEMGKSSLLLRLLAFADSRGYCNVTFNCNQIDSSCLDDLNKLLRCLCRRVAQELGVDSSNLDDYWDEEIGGKLSCSFYLHHLLKQIQHPVVLVLNEVDRFFEHPRIAQEFFALLRSWYEEARQDDDWQKLRLVVAYSTEEYINLDINRSPFNIGLPLRLNEFTRQQVEELVHRHGLNWDGDRVTQLMSLVGGHPALIRIALYCLCCQGMVLEDLIREALADGGIYHYHLWRHWMTIQDNPNLKNILADLLMTDNCLFLPPLEAYNLESIGLIYYDGNYFKFRCELYRTYFKKQLSFFYPVSKYKDSDHPI